MGGHTRFPGASILTGNIRPLLGFGQLRGVLVHPNVLAAIALLGLLLAIGRWMAVSDHRSRLLSSVAVALCVVALLLTGSRSAIATAVVSVIVLVWRPISTFAYQHARATAGVVALGVAVLPVMLLGSGVSLEGRERPWSLTLENWAPHRLFGYGPELLSRTWWAADDAPKFPDGWQPTHAHNIALHALGLGGLLALSGLLMAIGLMVWLAVRSSLRPVPLACATGMLIMGLTDSIFGRTEIPTTYLPLLLLAAITAAAMATHEDSPATQWPRPGAHEILVHDRLPVTVAAAPA